MCLITVCPKGTVKDMNKIKSFIENGMQSNTDGSGYACKKDGVIKMDKGFRDSNLLVKSIEDHNLGIDDELIIHHRIGTSGLKNAHNMHPFVVSNKDIELRTLISYRLDLPVMAHNGIFHQYTEKGSDNSDTYNFIKDFLSTPQFISVLIEDPKKFEKVFTGIIGMNKLAFIIPGKDLVMIGNFIQDDGFFHSNHGYKSFVFDRGGSSDRRFNGYGKQMDLDELSEEEWLNRRDNILGNIGGSFNTMKSLNSGIKKDRDLNGNPVKAALDIINGKKLSPLFKTIKFNSQEIKVSELNYKHFRLIVRKDTHNMFVVKGQVYEIEEFKDGVQFNPILRIGSDKIIHHVDLSGILPFCDIYVKEEFCSRYDGLRNLLNKSAFNPSLSLVKDIKKALSKNFKKDVFKFKGYGNFNWFDLNNYYNNVKHIYENKHDKTKHIIYTDDQFSEAEIYD